MSAGAAAHRRLAAHAAAPGRVARLRARRSRGGVRAPAARASPLGARGAGSGGRRSAASRRRRAASHRIRRIVTIPGRSMMRTLAADVRYALRVLVPRAVVHARRRRRPGARHRRQHRDLQHRQRRAAAAAAVRGAGSAGAAVPRAAAGDVPGHDDVRGVAGQLLRLAARRRGASRAWRIYRFRSVHADAAAAAPEAIVAGAVGAGFFEVVRARSRRSGACSCPRRTRRARSAS